MKPTIGRIVIVNLNDEHATLLGGNHDPKYGKEKKAPAMIVAVWSDTCVNLKVFGDSANNIWLTSSNQGDQPGQWAWPAIEK